MTQTNGSPEFPEQLEDIIGMLNDMRITVYEKPLDYIDLLLDKSETTSEEVVWKIKQLIVTGHDQGYLTYAEVNDRLPQGVVDPGQLEDIIGMFNDMGITVYKKPPNDPIRIYMREVTLVNLLNREGEVRIARRIESGLNQALRALGRYPPAVKSFIDAYEAYKKQERKLSEVIVGFVGSGRFDQEGFDQRRIHDSSAAAGK